MPILLSMRSCSTGDGDKAFISGADISQFETERSNAEAQLRYGEIVDAAYMAPVLVGKPVIAKIRGICMGGGLGLRGRLRHPRLRARCPFSHAGRPARSWLQAGRRAAFHLVDRRAEHLRHLLLGAGLRRGRCTAHGLRQPGVSVGRARCSGAARWPPSIAENAPLTARAVKLTVNAFPRRPRPTIRNGPGGHRRLQCQRGLSRRCAGLRREAQAGVRRTLTGAMRQRARSPECSAHTTTFGFRGIEETAYLLCRQTVYSIRATRCHRALQSVRCASAPALRTIDCMIKGEAHERVG